MKLSDPIKLPTGAFNQLNLHIAGVAALVILNIVLVVRLGFALRDLGSSRQEQLTQLQLQLAQLQAQTARLDGLPQKVEQSRLDADKFYKQRIPPNYSSILADLGAVASKNNVRLTRAGYTQTPALSGLAELRIDANLTGEYSGVTHFLNDLERDKTLYVIDTLTLTGQQGGLVNLRLRVTTYLHAEDASKLPPSSEPGQEEPAQPAASANDQSMLQPGPPLAEVR
jgi:type IV pilus assembly protein PilO